MRKAACVLLMLVMLVSMAAAGVCESLFVDNRETDKVYPERLNLRAEPSKNGAIIGLYYTGAEVKNLGAENEGYVKVSIGGVSGYMAAEYLITPQEAVSRYGKESGFGSCRAAQVDLTGMWQTTQELLSETDPKSDSLGAVQDGALVSLVGIVDTWAYIAAEIDGEKTLGYVPLDCLTDVGDLKASVVAGAKADTQTILYDAPNDKAQEIMKIKNGTACFSLFGRREGEWRRVRVGGVSGWIRYTQTDNLAVLDDGEARSAVPYYPLLMQTRREALLLREKDNQAGAYMTLGQDMKVEILAECGDYAYVRTLEGGAGAYDCGDFGYVLLSDLTLSAAQESVGVAQVDDGDLPLLLLDAPDEHAGVLGALCAGAQMRIQEYTQTDYIKVSLGSVTGYIEKRGVRILTRAGDASDRVPQRASLLEDAALKDAPRPDAGDVGLVPKGERAYMLGVVGDWAFVQYSASAGLDVGAATADGTGFVPLSALNAPASVTHLTAQAVKDKVNLRSRASSEDGEIIGRARTGELLRVADYGSEWSLVVTPQGTRGYIMTAYLLFE